MTGPALDAVGFILGTLLNLYAMVVALRFVMQTVRADYYNPIAQFVVQATDPLLKPMRRVIPSVGGHDTSSLLLAWAILFLKLIVFGTFALGSVPAIGSAYDVSRVAAPALAWIAFVDLVHLMFNIFIFSIFVQALLSWLPNAGASPVAGLLDRITAPVLNPLRRVIPPLGGLDLSALAALIGLFALQRFVVGVLIALV